MKMPLLLLPTLTKFTAKVLTIYKKTTKLKANEKISLAFFYSSIVVFF